MQGNLKQALEYAAKNPTSNFASEFARVVKSGAVDKQAQEMGIDLSPIKSSSLGGVAVQAKIVPAAQDEPQGRTGLAGVATGFAKRTASTLQNIGELVTKPLEKITGTEGELGIPEEKLKLSSTAERVGGLASDIASFAIPGTKVAGLTKGASLATRIGAEAALGGGATIAQQGRVDRSALDSAIISAAFPLAGKALQAGRRLTEGARKELAPRVVNSLIKPLPKNLSYGKNPGRAVAKLGITANSLDELAEKILVARNDVGEQLGKLYQASDKVFDVSDFLNPIDETIKKAKVAPRTNSALISRLQALKDDLLGVEVNELGEEVVTKNLKGLTAEEVFAFKKDISNLTKFTGNASDDTLVNSALQRTYGGLKEKLDKAIPEIVPLNELYGDLSSAEIATKYRDKILERQNLIKFTPKILSGAGVAGTIFTGGNPVPVLVGLGLAGVEKIAETTQFKTNLAKWLASAPTEQKKALFQKTPWMKGVILRTLVGEGSSQSNQ